MSLLMNNLSYKNINLSFSIVYRVGQAGQVGPFLLNPGNEFGKGRDVL